MLDRPAAGCPSTYPGGMGRGRRGDEGSRSAACEPGSRVLLAALTGSVLLAGLVGCDAAGGGPVTGTGAEHVTATEGSSGEGAVGAGGEETPRTGPIELAEPIDLVIVQESAAVPCADGYLPGPDGEECLLLGDKVRVAEVEQLEMATPSVPAGTTEEVLRVTLTDEDGAAFAELTKRAAELPEPRLAMVVEGEVIVAPTLAEPIPGDTLQIAGWDGAEQFVAEAHES